MAAAHPRAASLADEIGAGRSVRVRMNSHLLAEPDRREIKLAESLERKLVVHFDPLLLHERLFGEVREALRNFGRERQVHDLFAMLARTREREFDEGIAVVALDRLQH